MANLEARSRILCKRLSWTTVAAAIVAATIYAVAWIGGVKINPIGPFFITVALITSQFQVLLLMAEDTP